MALVAPSTWCVQSARLLTRCFSPPGGQPSVREERTWRLLLPGAPATCAPGIFPPNDEISTHRLRCMSGCTYLATLATCCSTIASAWIYCGCGSSARRPAITPYSLPNSRRNTSPHRPGPAHMSGARDARPPLVQRLWCAQHAVLLGRHTSLHTAIAASVHSTFCATRAPAHNKAIHPVSDTLPVASPVVSLTLVVSAAASDVAGRIRAQRRAG